MSDSPPFSLAGLGRARLQEAGEYESFLEALPAPALIVETQSQRIWLANARLVELCGFTRAELAWREISSLLKPLPPAGAQPAEENSTAENSPPQEAFQRAELARRNQSSLPVSLSSIPLPGKIRRSVILVDAYRLMHAMYGAGSDAKILESLHEMARAPLENALEPSLEHLLKAGASLTGAEILSIYYAQENSPMLRRSTSLGETCCLPELLPAQELIQLRQPQVWTPGKRPVSSLQRAARAGQLTWLASSPIGTPTASVALIVLAARSSPPSETLIAFTTLLATTATQLFQNYIQRKALLNQIQMLSGQQTVAAAIEEHADEGLVLLSGDLRIIRMNPIAEMMLGFGSYETRGQNAEKILIGAETLSAALSAAQQGSPTYNLGEVHLYRRNGDSFQAQVRIFPTFYEQGVENILVFIQDLTEQEQLRLHNQQLENRAVLGEVTAVFAHEVRNPINNISTGLQLLAMNLAQDDPNQNSIERLMQDCDRLAELIKSVLAFSRPTEYEFEQLDLAVLMRHLLERLHTRITRLNIEYSFTADPECKPVLGNLRALEQVFSNLINNALQAMGEGGGALAIRVQRLYSPEGKAYTEVSIADTGPGIPKELQEKIFMPFFTTHQSGTGLGLAITKRILTAHKGTILLNSFPGGTIFQVQLPAISNTD